MHFFTPKSEFTHYGRFYGFPCYFSGIDEDGPVIAGTNVIFDFCILHVAPVIHTTIDFFRWAVNPVEYEPMDWQLEVRGELPK